MPAPNVHSLPLRDVLVRIGQDQTGALAAQHAYHGLAADEVSRLSALGLETYTGKVRDVVFHGQELFIVHSDRLTAFDKLIAMVPYKGTILNAISAFWLAEAAKVVPTHFLGALGERVLRTRRTTPFKIEVVVRGYLAGSIMRAYSAGERSYCGVTLPSGLKPHGALPSPIITPTTKAAAFEHDENIDVETLIRRGTVTESEWRAIESLTLKLFQHGTAVFAKHGWILVDTKYEFGRDRDGTIMVIDEIHTPDSSRLWARASYQEKMAHGEPPEMLDKETVRRWLLEQGYKGEGQVPHVPVPRLMALGELYLDVAERLIGAPLMVDSRTPAPSPLAAILTSVGPAR